MPDAGELAVFSHETLYTEGIFSYLEQGRWSLLETEGATQKLGDESLRITQI